MSGAALLGRRAVLAGAACALAGGASGAGTATAIPLDTSTGSCVATVLLDGRPARLVLDTGAERTLLTSAAAIRLGLRRDPWVGTTMRGAGGMLTTHPNVDAGRASLGGTALYQRVPGGPLSLSVGDFDPAGADGLLGGDMLRHFTLGLDVPGRRLTLLPAGAALPAGALALNRVRGDLLLAGVTLDGQALTALVDTGASTTLLNARGCDRMGLPPALFSSGPGIASAAVGGTLRVALRRFTELRVGPLRVPAPVLAAAAVPEMAYDLTLGLDVLGRQPALISYTAPALGFGS